MYRRWPEILLDGPHQIVSGKEPWVCLLVKDADLFPTAIRALKFVVWDDFGRQTEREIQLDWRPVENLAHRVLAVPAEGMRGMVRIEAWITAENSQGVSTRFLNSNYPGLVPGPLEMRLLEHPLPYPADWKAGEMHCHSEFSSDPVEFGAPLALMQKAADSVGLDFVLCTDHSYDFYYHRERYLETCDPDANFAAYRKQAEDLNAANPALPLLVAGEEVSCGNHRGENVHLLVFGHERFLPGLGDGGRRGFKNRPDLGLAETLERLQGIPSFAAHPKARIGWLERKIFRRGQWHEADVSPQANRDGAALSIQGLQFWNGNLGSDYRAGKAFWVEQLLAGRRLLPIAANDAHGDFNRNIGVKLPLVSLYQSRSHLFGNVRTVVPSGQAAAALRQAFLGEQCLCTDGPFAALNLESSGRMRVRADTTPDFGELDAVRVYGAKAGDGAETLGREWKDCGQGMDEVFSLPWVSGYCRAEVITRSGKRAMTSAVYLGS